MAESLLRKLIPDDHACEDVLGELAEEFGRASGWYSSLRLRIRYWMAAFSIAAWYALERCRQARPAVLPDSIQGTNGMNNLRADLRLALRSVRRAPIPTLAIVVTLGLGIGANAAIFSVVNGVLLKPLPFQDPQQLVSVGHAAPGVGFRRLANTASTYLTYRDSGRAFEDIGVWSSAQVSVTGQARARRVTALYFSDAVLPLLRVRPALGRGFASSDAAPGAPETLILAHSFWQRHLGGDPDVVGRFLRMEGQRMEVIGVLPERFRFLDFEPAVILPLRVSPPGEEARPSFDYNALARLRPGVTLEDANRDLARMIPLVSERFPSFGRISLEEYRMAPSVLPLKDEIVGSVGRVLWLLLATVGLVLLIACANAANLFLIRIDSRRREIAVRKALGASKARVVRHFLVESVTLGLLGGVVGLGLAFWGVRLLIAMAPANLPRLGEVGIDSAVGFFTLGVSLLCGALFGILPVMLSGSEQLSSPLKEAGRGSSPGRKRHRFRHSLAALQVSIALALLIASGLMIRTFYLLGEVDPGFQRPEQVLTFRLSIPRAEVEDHMQAARLHQSILERLKAIPGVVEAGAASSITMEGRSNRNFVFAEGDSRPGSQTSPLRSYKAVAGDYFGAMGIPLLAGRTLTWDDILRKAAVGVVTESLAREHWGDPHQALGKRIRHDPSDPWREIVGVVGDVRDRGLREGVSGIAYWPMAVEDFLGFDLWVRRALTYVVRTERVDAVGLLPEVRDAIWSLNPNLPLAQVRTLDAVVARTLAPTAFALVMLSIAAALGVALGMVGLYGVISSIFAQRTPEIGVRMALGASPGDIGRMVLKQGGGVALVGIAGGLAAALALTGFMSSLLHGVARSDPLTYAAATLLVAVVCLLASVHPARRASRVDPIQSLRWG